jgi:GNAT superfamily N-acetyltransferase
LTTIRRATGSDAAAAAEVYIAARHHAVPAIPPMAHPDDDVRRHWAEVLLPNNEVWVAESDEGAVIGVLALEDDWLDQLYLAPGWTGRGIGTELLDVAKRQRPSGLRLWAFQSNTEALRFYERHEFVEVERTDGLDNEERSPDVQYRWTPAHQSG